MRPERSRMLPLAAAVGTLLLLSASAQEPAAEGQEPRPHPIDRRISVSPDHLVSIALEKPVAVADDLRVTHLAVGRFEELPEEPSAPDAPPRLRFVPATEIPLVPGEGFGWVVRFDTSRDSLVLTEEFVFPSPANITGSSGSTTISEDGKTATTPREFQSLWDWTYNIWTFEEGDPTGPHEFVVTVGDVEVARLEFKVTN